MKPIELIPVAFDGYGRDGHQARAAAALRAAGIERAFGSREVVAGADIVQRDPSPERAPGSGMMNEAALLDVTDEVNARVRAAVETGRMPFVYGGDCSGLLGALTGARDAAGATGLVLVDAHEDTTPLDASDDGEVANMEIGLLLGLTGRLAHPRLYARLPALDENALAMLGQRDEAFRRGLNVGSLRDRGVWARRYDEVAADPARAGSEAVEHVRAAASGWWLHVDVDVLALDQLTAQRVPGDEEDGDHEGGLTWPELASLLCAALAAGECRGWSLAIYDPEQDGSGAEAAQLVGLVRDAAGALTD